MVTLEIKNLTKHFDGVTALDDVSLSFEKGTITALIGPNGSGKTTLTHVLTGIHASDRGTVFLNGGVLRTIHRERVRDHGIARTFQDVRLFGQMSVLDNVLIVLSKRGVASSLFEHTRPAMRKRAVDILTRVGLLDKQLSHAETLSYGQRKLLEIARVEALDPAVIFFDEPFAGLFPEMVETIVDVMQEFRERGATQVLIEHTIDLIKRISDRVVVLDAGRVLATGSADEVLNNHAVIEAYLGN